MNNLEQIESILLPIFKELYKKDKEHLPRRFTTIVTEIIPKYLNQDIKNLDLKERNSIIVALKQCQSELNKLKLLSKDQNFDLNILIQQISKRESIKEQIENWPKSGELETSFVKDIVKDIRPNYLLRFEHSLLKSLKKGDFMIHTHKMPAGPLPSYQDLISAKNARHNPNTKFVIASMNEENKVIGYIIYTIDLTSEKNLISKFLGIFSGGKSMEENKETKFGVIERSGIGINYIYKIRAMPGYYWDDKNKIFKLKSK